MALAFWWVCRGTVPQTARKARRRASMAELNMSNPRTGRLQEKAMTVRPAAVTLRYVT